VYGLDVPEPIFREVYINRPDITPLSGWETGRKSEPAFMDMNMQALRGNTDPKIVLYQLDIEDPASPHGLLIAYAEAQVKPVVSDFDTFLVGQRNCELGALHPDQCKLATWALEHAEAILEQPLPGSWTSRWLSVIKKASQDGFYPHIPKYGLGDTTSYNIIKEVIQATTSTGAIRHGAECFNYFFPQELDEEYLVVWSGFAEDKPWEYMDEDAVREWLIDRVGEGFVFPMNPVWIVRDIGWEEVFRAMQDTEEGRKALAANFPPESKLKEKVEHLLELYPEGFLPNGNGVGGPQRKSIALDMDGDERANYAMMEAGRVTFAKVKCAMRATVLLSQTRIKTDARLSEVKSMSEGGEDGVDHVKSELLLECVRAADNCIQETNEPDTSPSRAVRFSQDS